MRKVVWQMMFSLDGFMAGPRGELDWHVIDDDFAKYVADMPKHIDTILFGRVTYEMMAAYWPTSTQPEAGMMNELPKLVFSRTTKAEPSWHNARLARGSITEEVEKLKSGPGRNIALLGSSDLASTFIQHGLNDEYRLLINPVALGAGQPLFKGLKERLSLKLESTQSFRSGVVVLTYAPDRKS